MGKMAKSRSVAMLMAVLVSGRAASVWYARKYLTTVEHADFLEDIHAIACTSAGRWAQPQIVASSDRLAL